MIGAQVVLDPASAASQGARGVYDSVEHNTIHRDAGYAELGLDPADPGSEPSAPDAPPTEPPGIVDTPYLSQSGAVLHCTMGNWENAPEGYYYQYQVDGMNVGTGTADYAIAPADVGLEAVCVVTATNAAGSTDAPPSNAVVVA